MSGIIIIPGFFNPPAEAIQKVRLVTWPVTPARGISRMEDQWQSMPATVEDLPAINIVYVRRDYTTGTVALRSSTYSSGITSFTTTGARCLPDRTYTKTSEETADGGTNYVSEAGATDIGFTPTGEIDIGVVDVPYNGLSNPSFNNVRVKLSYVLSVLGIPAGWVHSVLVPGAVTPIDPSGDIILGAPWLGNPESSGFSDLPIHAFPAITFLLKSGDDTYERVAYGLEIVGTAHFVVSTPVSQPTVETGLSIHETVYGPDAASAPVSVPGIPFIGYERESWAEIGTVILS